MTRCFLPPPLQAHAHVELPGPSALHVVRVLRLRVGAELTVFDGCGGEYPAQITTIARDQVRIALGPHQAIERESPLQVALLQSLARGDRMDLIVQKATELGVSAIVPLASQHSVVRLEGVAAARRLEHWRQVAIGACEQCGRNRIPSVAHVTEVATACQRFANGGRGQAGARGYLLDTEARQSLAAALAQDLSREGRANVDSEQSRPEVSLLIGPEGGWSQDERAIAQRCGFLPVHLGSRVLRAETAPLAALAVAQAIGGDLR